MMSVSVPVRRPTMIRIFRGVRPATAALTRSSPAFSSADEPLAPVGDIAGRCADLPNGRKHARQRSAIDDCGLEPERSELCGDRCSDPCGRRPGRASAARSSRHQASETCRPSAAPRRPADSGNRSRHADDAIAEAQRKQRLRDARRRRHDARRDRLRLRPARRRSRATAAQHEHARPRHEPSHR